MRLGEGAWVFKSNTLIRLVVVVIFALAELMATARVSFAQTITLGQAAGTAAANGDFNDSWQLAQSGRDEVLDVEPPLIEHEVVAENEAGIRQTFVATVVDDQELDRVQLYYRFKGESRYSLSTMNRVSFSSTWIAQIATDPATPQDMEYYIQANDKSGNRTVRGYAFNPLVRKIIPGPGAEVPAEEPAASTQPKTTNTRKTLYVVGGVLLLGLLASALGGGSSETPPPNGESCTDGRCTVTISTVRPF